MKTILVALLLALACTSCKKDYTCFCTNPGGEYKAFTVKKTEAKAKQQCDDYYQENYGTAPWNETVCEIR